VFSVADGRIFASELNSTDVNALSVATAEAQPDGLVRGIVQGGIYYAMGSATIEPWRNIGTAPFPLQRSPSVIPVGLKTAMAVAGFEPGWDRDPIFVAHDGTVRVLSGYDTAVISTPDVEAFIAASTVSTLEASVFTAKGKAFWALSSDRGTWVYEVTSQQWHERVSQGTSRWRASRSAKSGDKWVLGDTLSTKLLTVADNLTTEAGNPVAWTLESGPAKEFPVRIAIPAGFFDFTRAAGVSVQIAYSHDGGQSWSSPVTRALDDADRYAVRMNRMGLSTQHGMRVRLTSSSTADFSFMGATVPDLQPREP